MGKAITASLIDKYVKIIEEDFSPLVSSLRNRMEEVRDQVKVQVKKDLGIYELTLKKAALQHELREIKDRLRSYRDQERQPDGIYRSRIDYETHLRMQKLNTPLTEVERERDALIRKVKLTGITEDLREVFQLLPKVIEDLTQKFSTLSIPYNGSPTA